MGVLRVIDVAWSFRLLHFERRCGTLKLVQFVRLVLVASSRERMRESLLFVSLLLLVTMDGSLAHALVIAFAMYLAMFDC